MDGERGDGGAGEPEVADEFACAGMLRGSLASLHGIVERIFGVAFDIGVDDLSQGSNRQIWLRLRGQSNSVKAAKLFVRGVVNQEERQDVSYPGALHSVFCGARGLFVDCLMRSTSARIVVGSTGSVLISGLAEPVVRAYSLIADLVERCEATRSGCSEAAGDRGSGESRDLRRAFKALVEKWEDGRALDLLALPWSVKEILLDLVRESGLGSDPGPARGHPEERGSHGDPEGRWGSATYRWAEGVTPGPGNDSATEDSRFRSPPTPGGSRGRPEGAEGRLVRPPQEVGDEERVAAVDGQVEEDEEEEREMKFLLLLKFFTAMGYREDVVKRVLARTGPREASQILDIVQQEQDRSDQEQSVSERDRPSEMEHGEGHQVAAGGDDPMNNTGQVGEVSDREAGGATGSTEEDKEEDFVLGVVKKAAASCGYVEQEVARVYSRLPDGSIHQLLLELQRGDGRGEGAPRAGPREVDDVVPEKGGGEVGPVEEDEAETELFMPAEERESGDRGWVALPDVANLFPWNKTQPKLRKPQTPPQNTPPGVKGPPMPTYSSSLAPPHDAFQSNKPHGGHRPHPSTAKQAHVTQGGVCNAKPPPSDSSTRAPQDPQPADLAGKDSSSAGAGESRGAAAASSAAVTGEQRFLEGLLTPFELKIADEPGDATLRTVIIDGSNVAMSHGLSQFFSCRGIALAVQHFWDRGHRNIFALLPQWRQKSDPKAKEQHYLGALQTLGMVSYTPSREFAGKRITSYDDRLMLQLAQKTGGVIVTNDNLRDLSDESPVWRDIIKKRLLQYTFVGDHFMVPDDPLGRGGPHLDDFLRSEHSTPHPGNNSFAGATSPSSKAPRPLTEVLHFRDRTPGGARDAARGGGSRARGWRRDWKTGHQQQWQLGGDRPPEETASLREQLCLVFAGQDSMVALVLQSHPAETDINVLSDLILEQQRD